jgi:hypothetical protein
MVGLELHLHGNLEGKDVITLLILASQCFFGSGMMLDIELIKQIIARQCMDWQPIDVHLEMAQFIPTIVLRFF